MLPEVAFCDSRAVHSVALVRDPFLDEASSLNESSEKINQQNLLKRGVFYILKIISLSS